MIACAAAESRGSETEFIGRKETWAGLLTELHRVQRGHIAAKRLHREDGDFVSDIPRPFLPSAEGSLSMLCVGPAQASDLPGDNLRKSSVQ